MSGAVYEFKVDTNRDNSFSNATIDDLTSRLIGVANWSSGMASAYQDFNNPSVLSLTLDNIDGAFNPDTLGSELLTNGNFANWTADNPDSWTVAGEVSHDPEISQVSFDALHGGGGTGAANFYASSAIVSISQVILTVGISYRVQLDISASDNGTGWIAVYSGSTRISPYYHQAGSYIFYFNAVSTTFKIASSGAVNMTVDTVSVKASSLYGQLLTEGTLGRLKATFNAVTYTLFIGRLSQFTVMPGSINGRRTILQFTDPTLDMLDTEYIPILDTNITADVAIARVLNESVVPFPYAHSYWMLGTQGASELDLTTTIYNPPSYSLDTGKTTYAWVGDNSIDNNAGVSAQTYLRDVVTGETGGRFFYDPALPGYKFHSRHRDPLNMTIAFTITDSDYEADSSNFTRPSVINSSAITYQPRKIGTPLSTLWSDDSVPVTLSPGVTTKSARFRDATNESARVGATYVQPLLAGVDYTATDVNGNDVTGSLGVSMTPGANSADLKLTNFLTGDMTLTLLQVRGTPLTSFTPQTVSSINVDSQYATKVAPERMNFNMISSENDAQAIADFHAYKFSIASSAFSTISFIANKSDTRMVNALALAVGQRITISDTFLSHSADYFVVGFRHTVTWGGEHTHVSSIILKPADRETYWILDTSLLNTGTRLAL